LAPGPEPRLLDLNQAAVYLNVSFWTVRDWCLAGHLPTVELPALTARKGDHQRRCLRRVLVDRQDLDRFIDARKVNARESSTSAPENAAAQTRDIGSGVPTVCPARGSR
jgi:hypothetical protein